MRKHISTVCALDAVIKEIEMVCQTKSKISAFYSEAKEMKHRSCGYPQISRFADAKQLFILSQMNLVLS